MTLPDYQLPIGGTLAAGASCNIRATFTPTTNSGTLESARIVINDTANNSPQTVYLSGTGSN